LIGILFVLVLAFYALVKFWVSLDSSGDNEQTKLVRVLMLIWLFYMMS
jgi:hypothetical protein